MLRERLARHHLAGHGLPAPDDVVRWFGAVQAQDFPGALWALGQRLAMARTEADVLAAFDAGALIRTHVLRPTWHFVAAGGSAVDARADGATHPGSQPRHVTRNSVSTRRPDVKAERVFARALAGGRHLTRQELAAALRRARVDPDGQRLVHLLMHAELEALVCSGPRVGKQLTYALVDDRVPVDSRSPREDALATLFTRYFTSHGPATVRGRSMVVGPAAWRRARRHRAGRRRASQRRMIDGRGVLVGSRQRPAGVAARPPAARAVRAPSTQL